MDRYKAYSILGLSQDAGEDEVKAAYRAMAQKYDLNNYEIGNPMREEAEFKMNEINEAFDVLMSYLRAGSAGPATQEPHRYGQGANQGRYPAIREMINTGRADDAIQELSAVQGGSSDAEWNFLMGSAYYYKGWLDKALRYFQEAVRLEPGNMEYEAALRNLNGAAQGQMHGNPYQQADPNTAAMNCACNYCTMMCCMDAMCGICRGC